jgi:predicted protein tyrosine phosphatase
MTMNRIHNCTNPYQGDAKRVLCVCSAGLLRSPTTAVVLNQEYGYNTRAAGMDESFALICVDDVLLHWADEIVCVEDVHVRQIKERLDKLRIVDKPVISLGIPDSFAYMDNKLVLLIKNSYLRHLHMTVGWSDDQNT